MMDKVNLTPELLRELQLKQLDMLVYFKEFCEKNDAPSQSIIGRIFEGIDEDQLRVTIETIMAMERNVSKL